MDEKAGDPLETEHRYAMVLTHWMVTDGDHIGTQISESCKVFIIANLSFIRMGGV